MKKNNKKGFTLAELLVVVGIIAILVAIAIPTFNAATDRAEYGVELANARSTYAEAKISAISSRDGETMDNSFKTTGITYDNVTYKVTQNSTTSYTVELTGSKQIGSVEFSENGVYVIKDTSGNVITN